jgi:hypothetical protein
VGSGAVTLIVNVVNILNAVLSFYVEKKISDVMALRDGLYIRVNAQKREGIGGGRGSWMAQLLRTSPRSSRIRSNLPEGVSESAGILRNPGDNDEEGPPRRRRASMGVCGGAMPA